MGYFNPIMQYGFENFCRSCHEVGVDGVIIPDLPFKDYLEEYKPVADRYDLNVIMLITPETSGRTYPIYRPEYRRIYLYGIFCGNDRAQQSFDEAKQEYFRRIAAMNLRNPRLIGFGISNRETFDSACRNASGAIIGSQFVKLLAQDSPAKSCFSIIGDDREKVS